MSKVKVRYLKPYNGRFGGDSGLMTRSEAEALATGPDPTVVIIVPKEKAEANGEVPVNKAIGLENNGPTPPPIPTTDVTPDPSAIVDNTNT